MEYKEFEINFFNNLQNQDEGECLNEITLNQGIIRRYLGDEGEKCLAGSFVEKLNDFILHNLSNVEILNKILQNELFNKVVTVFRESNILLRSCMDKCDEKVIKWLLTMDINPFVTDEHGMTALMYAAKNPDLVFVVEHYIDMNNEKLLYHVDNNGENVLFHSIYNLFAFKLLVKTSIDINHKNKDEETVLLRCCKYEDARYAIPYLCNHPQLDPNIPDKEGMTGPLYLVEKGSHRQLFLLKNIDMEYRNKNDENVLTLLFRKLYEARNEPTLYSLVPYMTIFKNFVEKKIDLNVAIDKDGNTPLMYFIMIYDKCTIFYLVNEYKNLTLNVKNKYGEDAILMATKLDYFEIVQLLLKKRRYNYDCYDSHNNNLLMYWALKNHIEGINKTFKYNKGVLNKVNDNNETALIVATKLRNLKAVKSLLSKNAEVDHQDNLGNTALYYAIDIENDVIVNRLLYYNADPNLKNNKGQSPYELAEEIDNEVILNLLENPVDPKKYESKSIQEKLSSIKNITKSLKKSNNKIVTDINDPNFDVNIDFKFKSKYQTVISHSMKNIEGKRYEPFPDYMKFKKFLFTEFYCYSTEYNDVTKFIGEIGNSNVSKGIKRLNTGVQIVSMVTRFIV